MRRSASAAVHNPSARTAFALRMMSWEPLRGKKLTLEVAYAVIDVCSGPDGDARIDAKRRDDDDVPDDVPDESSEEKWPLKPGGAEPVSGSAPPR